MKAYKRIDFIKLPANIIYSRLSNEYFNGLYCKTSGPEDGWGNDWIEVDLISQVKFPVGIKDGGDAICAFEENNITKGEPFETDMTAGGRDGCFDESDIFIVWDKDDIAKLISYLTNAIK